MPTSISRNFKLSRPSDETGGYANDGIIGILYEAARNQGAENVSFFLKEGRERADQEVTAACEFNQNSDFTP